MDIGGIGSLIGGKASLVSQNQGLPEAGGDHSKVGEEFETLMATMLVKEMRKSLPNGFFGSGPGSDTFGGWLDKTIGDSLAGNWDLNIAGMVKTGLDSKLARLNSSTTPGASE